MSTGTPPVVPSNLLPYNSYVIDPKWQIKFTIIWCSVLAAAVVFSLPRVIALRRLIFVGFFGIKEDLDARGRYDVVSDNNHNAQQEVPRRKKGTLQALARSAVALIYWSVPRVELNLGQIILVAAYLAVAMLCSSKDAPLLSTPNRAGFVALAQLPPVFLFATKNSPLSVLLGPGVGYEQLNFIHRWSARGLLLGALVHGSLWIRNHLIYNIEIIGAQKETSGVAALGVLCGIFLTSLRVVRRASWRFFFVAHVLGFPAFFITICYHTPYARPWVYPPLAVYGLDLLMRMFRIRIKDASLTSVDNQMTLIRVHDSHSGWRAGQHVRLRVFLGGGARVLESHPLSIANAPPATTCLTYAGAGVAPEGTILLGARVGGDWTRALNEYAQSEEIVWEEMVASKKAGGEKGKEKNQASDDEIEEVVEACPDCAPVPEVKGTGEGDEVPEWAGAPVQVSVCGPYGGCSIDLGAYETVLLIAGGSGVTFTLGLLDDIVGRCVRRGREQGERTRRIQFVWCVRSFGSIEWFAPMLMEIATAAATCPTLDLHIRIFVTCLCDPEAVPPIPNSEVTIERPSVTELLYAVLQPPMAELPSRTESLSNGSEIEVVSRNAVGPSSSDPEKSAAKDAPGLEWVGLGGGVGVCAAGPETLTREAQNAVARMSLTRGLETGGIALHTELYAV